METSSKDLELTIEERQLLQLVYEHFDKALEWPATAVVKRRLYQSGYQNLGIEDLLVRLAPALAREIESGVGRQLRLTLAGFRALYQQIELNDFVCFLRLAVEKYGQPGAEKKIHTSEVAQRCGLDSHRLRKLDVLLQGEIYVAHPSSRGIDGGPVEWEIDDEVTRYRDVFTSDDYLGARARELRALATADIPPVHLLAAEGIPWARPHGSASDHEPLLGQLVEDSELRERCGDLLLAGGKFDRVFREATVVLEHRVRDAIGGSERLGVDLMQFAFSEKDPKLILSDNPKEQAGALRIYSGVMSFFRNPAGHRLLDVYSRDDAVRFVATIDLLLALIARASRK